MDMFKGKPFLRGLVWVIALIGLLIAGCDTLSDSGGGTSSTTTTPTTDSGGTSGSGKSWKTPVRVSNSTYIADRPQIAMDGNGNAIVVWAQTQSTVYDIYAARFTPVSGWSTPTSIENLSNSSDYPHVAVDANGNAFAVWSVRYAITSEQSRVYVNRFTFSSNSWGLPEPVDDMSHNWSSNMPRVAFDKNGNAIVVWYQIDSPENKETIYANRWSAGSGIWGTAQKLSNTNGEAIDPQIAIDSSGNALAVWSQNYAGTENGIYASQYTVGTWNTLPIRISNYYNNVYYNTPVIAFDASNNAFAVWSQSNENPNENTGIYAVRYAGSLGWASSPEKIGGENATITGNPRLAFDGSGNAFVVWAQSEGVYCARYDATSNSWETATRVSEGGLFYRDPRIVADTQGNALAVWVQDNDQLYSARYNASTKKWETPLRIEDLAGKAYLPEIAMDGNGKAIVVWAQEEGSNMAIYAARYE